MGAARPRADFCRALGDAAHCLAGADDGVVRPGPANSIFTVAVTAGPLVFVGVAETVRGLNPDLVAVAQVYQLEGKARLQSLD